MSCFIMLYSVSNKVPHYIDNEKSPVRFIRSNVILSS